MTKQIIRLVESKGYVLQRQKHHYVFKHPSGVVFACGKTLGDQRAIKNIEKEAERQLRNVLNRRPG
jgi:predicted RNA binding protein YcfA (HicA-like mRNA interferase family)